MQRGPFLAVISKFCKFVNFLLWSILKFCLRRESQWWMQRNPDVRSSYGEAVNYSRAVSRSTSLSFGLSVFYSFKWRIFKNGQREFFFIPVGHNSSPKLEDCSVGYNGDDNKCSVQCMCNYSPLVCILVLIIRSAVYVKPEDVSFQIWISSRDPATEDSNSWLVLGGTAEPVKEGCGC
jgi:hypothetical protein